MVRPTSRKQQSDRVNSVQRRPGPDGPDRRGAGGPLGGSQGPPAAVADDGEFLRRVSLDLIGKIPTAAEARDFLDDPSRDKRLALVERLLDSPAYTTRATEIWRRLLLPEADTEDLARQVAGNFEAWLRKKVIEEAGYDRIVREILTAKLNGSKCRRRRCPYARSLSRGLLHGQGEQAREHRGRRGTRFPGHPPGMCPVPQSPVRQLEAGTILEPRRLLRGRAAAGC